MKKSATIPALVQFLNITKDGGVAFIVKRYDILIMKGVKKYNSVLTLFLIVSLFLMYFLTKKVTDINANTDIVYQKFTIVRIVKNNCPITSSPYSQKYAKAEYSCFGHEGPWSTIGGTSSFGCQSAASLVKSVQQACDKIKAAGERCSNVSNCLQPKTGSVYCENGVCKYYSTTSIPATPTTITKNNDAVLSLTPIQKAPISISPSTGSKFSCVPNNFIAGTYCTSTSTCYDIKCNVSGNAVVNVNYSGSTCAYCATYKCTPNGFLSGTYYNGSNMFDVYCNSSGNGTTVRNYY